MKTRFSKAFLWLKNHKKKLKNSTCTQRIILYFILYFSFILNTQEPRQIPGLNLTDWVGTFVTLNLVPIKGIIFFCIDRPRSLLKNSLRYQGNTALWICSITFFLHESRWSSILLVLTNTLNEKIFNLSIL